MLRIDAPLASRRKPEEGGSVAIVKANGCTLLCKDNDDEVVLTDLQNVFKRLQRGRYIRLYDHDESMVIEGTYQIDRSSLVAPLKGSIFAVPAVPV